jgi:hypothetical protein
MVRPQPNETDFDFSIRAHKALMDEIPDTDDRNRAVWSLWDEHGSPDKCVELAHKTFDAGKYAVSPDHCYFVEHETVKRVGDKEEPIRYSAKDLADIIQHNRKRIKTRGAFAAISDGHTSDSKDGKKAEQPGILGFISNYRLGMVGHEEPVFAIFAEERHRKDKIDRIRELPRRSVELITNRRTGERYFDPVAALGSEAPRLAMPAKYSVDEADVDVERYSFSGAPAYASGGNTFVTNDDYSMQGDMMHNSQTMEIPDQSDEFIAKVVDAIMRTDPMRWVQEQMEFERSLTEAGMNQASQPSPQMGGMGGQPAPAPAPAAGPPSGGPPGGGAPGGGQEESETDLSPVPEESNNKERMSMSQNTDTQVDRFASEEFVERYQALEAKHTALETQFTELVKQHSQVIDTLANLNKEKADALRARRISELAHRYSILDQDEETERCLYSKGSNMSDDDFEKHVKDIERYAARAETRSASYVPAGVMPESEMSTERYQAICSRARDIHDRESAEGNYHSWDKLVEMATAEMRKA